MKNSKLKFNDNLHVLAEIGVNHEGSVSKAKHLIGLAKDAGCMSVKLQAYRAESLVTRAATAYWDKTQEGTESQYELFKKYDSFEIKDYAELSRHAHSLGLQFGLSIFDIDWIEPLGEYIDYFKIASGDITFLPLLELVSMYQKPVILSTGAATLEEIRQSHEILTSRGNSDVSLLHCILSYPTQLYDSNLGFIRKLVQAFPGVRVGISDHVPDLETDRFMIARTLGASIIEKHFTDDPTLPGNDHYHAGTPNFFSDLILKIRQTDLLLGSEREFLDIEIPARLGARRSAVYKSAMAAGEILSLDSFQYKRPGSGISPFHTSHLVGKVLKRDVFADEQVALTDLE